MPGPLESEWLHLRRKRMPWILLALLPVISLLAFWLVALFGLGPAPAELQMSQSYIDPSAGRISITITCADVINDAYLSDVTTLSQDVQRTILAKFKIFRLATCEPFVVIRPNPLHLVPPLGIEIVIKLIYEIAVIIVMILGASVMGWQLKSKPSHMIDIVGHKRWQVVAAKALLVVILGAAGMLAVAAVYGISSFVHLWILRLPEGESAFLGQWTGAVSAFGKAVFGLVPYALLSMLVTLFSGSSKIGGVLSIGYLVAEGFAIGWSGNFYPFILGGAVAEWLRLPPAVKFARGDTAASLLDNQFDAFHVALIMLAYCAVFLAITIWKYRYAGIRLPKY